MRRTAFKSRRKPEAPAVEREPHPVAFTVRPLVRGVYGSAVTVAEPKPSTPRNPAVMDMAKGRRCIFQVPGICTGDHSKTVGCHENQGKGMALKASDASVVFGCAACHEWYDRGTAMRAVKRAYYELAYLRQLDELRRIALDMKEPIRFRRAAQWVLEQGENK